MSRYIPYVWVNGEKITEEKLNNLEQGVSAAMAAVGHANAAATKAAMTDITKVYVYTGSESGMVNGNWYYYDGTAWVSGGVYQATAIQTDKTLTVENEAADAKATGNIITDLKNALSQMSYMADDLRNANLFPAVRKTQTGTLNITPVEYSGIQISGTIPYQSNVALTNWSLNLSAGTYTLYVVSKNNVEYPIPFNFDIYNVNGMVYPVRLRDPLTFTVASSVANSALRFYMNDSTYSSGFSVNDTLYIYLCPGSHTLEEFNEVLALEKNIDAMSEYNAVNILKDVPWPYHNWQGVSFTWDGEKYIGKGTSTAAGSYNLYVHTDQLPGGLKVGDLMTFHIEGSMTNVTPQMIFYYNGAWGGARNLINGYQTLVPAGTTGINIRFRIEGANLPVSGTCRMEAIRVSSNEMLETYAKADHAFIILTNNGRVSIDLANTAISISESLYINGFYDRLTITTSDVVSMLSSSASYDGDTGIVTITIPNGNCLVYRYSISSLKIVGVQEIRPEDIVLYCSYYRNNFGLLWDKYWRDRYVDSGDPISAVSIFNGEPFTGAYDYETPIVRYCKLFNGKSSVESFAFFTDPHTMGFEDSDRNTVGYQNYCKRIQKTYRSTPCSFLICGGDWLNNTTTKDEACYRLGLLKGTATHLLDGCYLVLGNHDTNYQGKEDADAGIWTGQLSNDTIFSLLYRDTDTHKSYYSFDGAIAKCYVLDTGSDYQHTTMFAYDWEQIAWLAQKLHDDDSDHSIIFIHNVIYNGTVPTNTTNFASLVQAYNSHTTITLNGSTYDFTSCTGHVDFWVAGHTHSDTNGTLGGIPYIITGSNASTSDVPLIDLFLVDYTSRKINTVRVGGGSDRVLDF